MHKIYQYLGLKFLTAKIYNFIKKENYMFAKYEHKRALKSRKSIE